MRRFSRKFLVNKSKMTLNYKMKKSKHNVKIFQSEWEKKKEKKKRLSRRVVVTSTLAKKERKGKLDSIWHFLFVYFFFSPYSFSAIFRSSFAARRSSASMIDWKKWEMIFSFLPPAEEKSEKEEVKKEDVKGEEGDDEEKEGPRNIWWRKLWRGGGGGGDI